MKVYLLIARHIDDPPVVQCRMKNSHGIIFCHIDLIKDPKAAIGRTLIDRPFPERHFVIPEGIGTNERTAVCIYMERYIINRTAKDPGQIFRQDIFSGGFRTAEQDVFPCKDSCHRHLENIGAKEMHLRSSHPPLYPFLHRVGSPESLHIPDQAFRKVLFS